MPRLRCRPALCVVMPAQRRTWCGSSAAAACEQRAVRLGLRTLEAAEVLEGLAAGDMVLVGDAPPPGKRVHADVNAVAAAATKPAREDAGSAMTNAMGR